MNWPSLPVVGFWWSVLHGILERITSGTHAEGGVCPEGEEKGWGRPPDQIRDQETGGDAWGSAPAPRRAKSGVLEVNQCPGTVTWRKLAQRTMQMDL